MLRRICIPLFMQMVMNEVTVLEELGKYMKQLQEKVKTLEEQMNLESGSCSSSENSTIVPPELPQIEATVSGRDVRVRILCVKCKGVLSKVLTEIEKLDISVVSSSTVPFGTSLHHISLVAQV